MGPIYFIRAQHARRVTRAVSHGQHTYTIRIKLNKRTHDINQSDTMCDARDLQYNLSGDNCLLATL